MVMFFPFLSLVLRSWGVNWEELPSTAVIVFRLLSAFCLHVSCKIASWISIFPFLLFNLGEKRKEGKKKRGEKRKQAPASPGFALKSRSDAGCGSEGELAGPGRLRTALTALRRQAVLKYG